MNKAASVLAMALLLCVACGLKRSVAPTDTTTTTTHSVPTATAKTWPTPVNPETRQPVPDVIEHFKFWSVDGGTVAPPRHVDLRLPGGPQWSEMVSDIPYLANPVQKNGIEVPDARKPLHYDAYQLHDAPPQQAAHFYNQFTDDAVWPLTPERPLLLVPAIKSHTEGGVADEPPQMPEYHHHFVCYAYASPPDQNAWIKVERTKPHHVDLLDQFDTTEEEIRKLQPAYFCFPVEKRYQDGEWEQPANDLGLALYNIDPRRPYPQPVWTRDQFDQHTLHIKESAMLGVPSVWK